MTERNLEEDVGNTAIEPMGEGVRGVRYLTLRECARKLRAAGMAADPRLLRTWIRDHRVRDVWVLGRHTFIYEAEIEALIAAERSV